MKGLKLIGIVLSVVGAIAGVAGEYIDRQEDKEYIKEEVAKQLKAKESE